jgi:hypothetical protein
LTPGEVEAFYKIDKLRREIDSLARAAVLRLVAAIAVAFAAGWALGRLWR